MQKKLFLPVAVLGLALVATGCGGGNYGTNQGLGTPNNTTTPNTINQRGNQGLMPGTNNGLRGVNNPDMSGWNRGGYYNNNLTGTGNTLDGTRNNFNNNRMAGDRGFMANDDADRIADLAAGVDGVDSSKAFIIGNIAYVGLDIDEGISADRAVPIQDEVVRAVQRAMPDYDIRVTSDKGFFQRIGAISTGMRNGDRADRYNNDIDFLNRNMNTNIGDTNVGRTGTNIGGTNRR